MPSVPSRARWLAPLVAALLLCPGTALLPPDSARAEVYKWVDRNGVTHYTIEREELPPGMRRRPRPRVATTPPVAAAPAPMAAGPAPMAAAPAPVAAAPERVGLSEAPPDFGPEGEAAESPPGEDPEILELEAQIRSDREMLKSVISAARGTGTEFISDPQLREIAERLPRRQAELEALRREAER